MHTGPGNLYRQDAFPMSPTPPMAPSCNPGSARRHWVLLSLLATAGACGSQQDAPPENDSAPDMVLVLVAGLRADPPDSPGAERAFLAPFQGRISLRATAAYAQSPVPRVSLGSLLTGRYPSAIPLCGAIVEDPETQIEQPWCYTMPQNRETLPGVLGLYGFRTAMFQSNLAGGAQLGQTFQHYVDLTESWTSWETPWERLEDEATAWWSKNSDHPRLLVLMLPDMQAQHRPDLREAMGLPGLPDRREAALRRDLRPSVLDELRESGQLSSIDGLGDQSGRRQASPTDGQRPRAGGSPRHHGRGAKPGHPTEHWRDLDHQTVLDTYASGAAEVGRQVDRLLARLDPSQRERIVLLSSTNGISMGEHSGTTVLPHGFAWSNLVLDRTVHVPLVFLGPSPSETELIEHPVELADIMPTLLSSADVIVPHGLPGAALGGPARSAEDELAFMEFGDMLAIRQGEHLFTFRAMLHHCTSLDPDLTEILLEPGKDSTYSLHDILEDPMQENALAADTSTLREALIEIRTGLGAPPTHISNEQFRELRLTPTEGYW